MKGGETLFTIKAASKLAAIISIGSLNPMTTEPASMSRLPYSIKGGVESGWNPLRGANIRVF